MRAYRIPIAPGITDQTMQIELGGNPYRLRTLWNELGGYWSLSLLTVADEPILTNIKVVRDFPLLAAFADTRLPAGDLLLLRDRGADLSVTYDNFGDVFALYYYEVDAPVLDLPVTEIAAADPVSLGTDWDAGETEWDSRLTVWDM
jgi:hypothetical protein